MHRYGRNVRTSVRARTHTHARVHTRSCTHARFQAHAPSVHKAHALTQACTHAASTGGVLVLWGGQSRVRTADTSGCRRTRPSTSTGGRAAHSGSSASNHSWQPHHPNNTRTRAWTHIHTYTRTHTQNAALVPCWQHRWHVPRLEAAGHVGCCKVLIIGCMLLVVGCILHATWSVGMTSRALRGASRQSSSGA